MAKLVSDFKHQLNLTNFWFHWNSENDFVEPKWKCLAGVRYVLMRWLFFIYCFIFMVLSIWNVNSYRWLFALTSLNYILVTIYFMYGAINITNYRLTVTQESQEPKNIVRFRFKVHWFLYNLALGMCTFVFVAFWVMLAPNRTGGYEPSLHTFLVIDRHGINLVLMIIDFAINRIPLRLLHCVYSSLFLGLYLVYNSIYWSVSGDLIYGKILDYGSNGGMVTGLAFGGMLVAFPIVQLLWFLLHCLKKKDSKLRQDSNANVEFQDVC